MYTNVGSFHQADSRFLPNSIVAWRMHSDRDTIESQTLTNAVLSESLKLYREAVEDLLVLEPLCMPVEL